ncbi:MAG TPA: tyrosine-type recombinase/integrase [Bacteroidales bacterium]|nr:tyrosine-type recombinase/integrase [Bacteroidales bacterium]
MPVLKYIKNGEQVRKDGKNGWLLDHTLYNDKRKKKVFYGTKTQAESRLSQLINQQNEIRAGHKKPIDVDPKRISEVSKDHCRDLVQNKDRSPNTAQRYKDAVDAFRKLVGNLYINEVTEQHINEFKQKRRQVDEVSAAGINCDLRSLRALLNFAQKQGYIGADAYPFKYVEMASDRGKYEKQEGVRYFSEDEMLQIAGAIRANNDIEKLELYKMYLYSGARASEILPISDFRWENIDFKNKKVTFNQRKTSSVRTVELVPQVETIMKARRRRYPDGEYPFDYPYHHVDNTLVRKYMRRHCGLPNVSLQTLRRTTGAILLKSGWNIYDVSKYLGHTSVKTTEKHYVDLLKERAENMAKDLGKYIGNL